MSAAEGSKCDCLISATFELGFWIQHCTRVITGPQKGFGGAPILQYQRKQGAEGRSFSKPGPGSISLHIESPRLQTFTAKQRAPASRSSWGASFGNSAKRRGKHCIRCPIEFIPVRHCLDEIRLESWPITIQSRRPGPTS